VTTEAAPVLAARAAEVVAAVDRGLGSQVIIRANG
jgi:hypothetical protein